MPAETDQTTDQATSEERATHGAPSPLGGADRTDAAASVAQAAAFTSLPASRAERGDLPSRSNSAATTAMAGAIGMGLAMQSGSQDGLAAFAKTSDGLTDGAPSSVAARRASIRSQIIAAISGPPSRLTARMPVGEVTLISVR